MNKEILARVYASFENYQLTKPCKKDILIKSKKIDRFFQLFWDDIEVLFNHPPTIHSLANYHPYIYNHSKFLIHESSFFLESRPTVGLISFVINKEKGITTVFVSATDKSDSNTKNHVEDSKCVNDIFKSIESSIISLNISSAKSPIAIASVILHSNYAISGLYKINDEHDITIYPISINVNESDDNVNESDDNANESDDNANESDDNANESNVSRSNYSRLDFILYEKSQYNQVAELRKRAEDISSSLTLLTQNLFIPILDSYSICTIEANTERESHLKQLTLGSFTNDEDMFKRNPYAFKLVVSTQESFSEIIEMRDVIKNEKLRFPQYIKEALEIILADERLIRSARRFQEGLILEHQTIIHNGNLGFMVIPYQLIAFVASIESLLDTKPQQTMPCESCDKTVITYASQITKKFNSFIDEYIGYNPIINKAFKNLYKDRSKFVHEGRDVFNANAKVRNRPYRFKGTKIQEKFPDYYTSIGDYTGLVIRKYIYRKISISILPIWKQKINYLMGLLDSYITHLAYILRYGKD